MCPPSYNHNVSWITYGSWPWSIKHPVKIRTQFRGKSMYMRVCVCVFAYVYLLNNNYLVLRKTTGFSLAKKNFYLVSKEITKKLCDS